MDYDSPIIDPWQHRSEGMRCKSCMWFAQKLGDVGRCRRHAPTMSGYPVVFHADWCGDHKLSEEARAVRVKEEYYKEMAAQEREACRREEMKRVEIRNANRFCESEP